MFIKGDNMKVIWGIIAPLLLAATGAYADEMPVNPEVAHRPGAPASGNVVRTATGNVNIRLINSCFGTNLRSVSNPLAPTSIIEAQVPISVADTTNNTTTAYNLWVKYPAALVTAEGITTDPTGTIDPSLFGGLDGMTAAIYGNTVQLVVPANKLSITVNADGTATTVVTSKLSAGQPAFIQHITSCDGPPVYGSWGYSSYTPTYPCQAYMGQEGPLSATMGDISIATDQSSMDVPVSFPGQTGFCGGYYSPLMLFFGKERPSFTGKSSFQLSAAGKTTWVEAGSPGYFLVIDRNHNGKVDGKEELFGDQDSDKNGFDSLKELDSNKDGVINAKDKKWKQLFLWNDKNGDGVSQPDELEPLSKRVTKISLKYKASHRAYGANAQARQVGEFWYKDGKKTQKGVIEDIWFAPINGEAKK